jgi:MoaA/NifB/PqqE/SkfB family radical SAM enzyme
VLTIIALRRAIQNDWVPCLQRAMARLLARKPAVIQRVSNQSVPHLPLVTVQHQIDRQTAPVPGKIGDCGERSPAGSYTDPHDTDLRRLLLTIRNQQTRYRDVHREQGVHGFRSDPERYCDYLLSEIFAEYAVTPTAFFAWAVERYDRPPLLHVLAAHHALCAGWSDRAAIHARKAVALDQSDLYAQRLVMLSAPDRGRALAETEAWLADRFCPRPFEVLETRPNGDVNTCCDAWMPAAIGNIADASADHVWNSSRAQQIRQSVLDGNFRYCSRMFCPKIAGRHLPRRTDVQGPRHAAIVRERRTVLPYGPARVILSHDRSCNLSCPSCRRHLIVADKAKQDELNELAEKVVLPLLRDARLIKITGSGDPFGSNHFRHVLRRLNRREFPNLLLEIQTNGQLLDRRAWSDLELEGLVESVWVSIDAARPATYEHLRRGGSFDRLMRNLAFVAGLRREGRIRSFQLDAVVQAANLDELPEIVDLGLRLGADRVSFQRIRNWGTFTAADFADHDVSSSRHPRFADLCAVLRDPRLAGPYVDLGNLASL